LVFGIADKLIMPLLFMTFSTIASRVNHARSSLIFIRVLDVITCNDVIQIEPSVKV
jgi:hypothetical protein